MAVPVKACEMELLKTPNRHSVTAGPTAVASFGLAVEVLLGEMQARSACYNIAHIKQTVVVRATQASSETPHPHPPFFVFSPFFGRSCRYRTKDDRAFSHFGPSVWNSLPSHIRNAATIAAFQVRSEDTFL